MYNKSTKRNGKIVRMLGVIIITNEFDGFLRKLRKEKGLTIVQLAEKTGLSRSYISQLERGERGKNGIPSIDVLQKLSTALEINIIDLLKKTGYTHTQKLSLSETIRTLRKEKGWSIEDLSEKTLEDEDIEFIPKERLYEFENGQSKNPTISEIVTLAFVFEVSFSRFTVASDIEIPITELLRLSIMDAEMNFGLTEDARSQMIEKGVNSYLEDSERIKIFNGIQALNSVEDELINKILAAKDQLSDIYFKYSDTNDEINETSQTTNSENISQFSMKDEVYKKSEIGNLILFNPNVNYKGNVLSFEQRRTIFEAITKIMEQEEN
ncbi:helix-turn-helix domain-containing protein [Rummeliibacillus sp. POC4]|uniref:helix-turn-helix domain-containing protein n=1 Tax=Rummeliibacillus sp. POC4 TaxID=2305899 RepID=UPI000E66A390|nr:helix-turn-helix transcriptional regulator [Rummeliibacillus sp. POC4]RIJ64162.1 transcriptional regulator [Rummeliibacillus sp. POC4]